MNIKAILTAMSVLEKAGHALRCGGLNVAAQMQLGKECYESEFALQLGLERDFPEVKIDRHSTDLSKRVEQ